MLAHKADTEERHRVLSAASFATWPQLHPRAFISRSTEFFPRLFWSPPPPVSSGGPAHGYSWNGCMWHSVNMANPPPSSFLYLYRDGQHPSSLEELRIGYLVWPKDVQNSSKALVLEYFQRVAYFFGLCYSLALRSPITISNTSCRVWFLFLLLVVHRIRP